MNEGGKGLNGTQPIVPWDYGASRPAPEKSVPAINSSELLPLFAAVKRILGDHITMVLDCGGKSANFLVSSGQSKKDRPHALAHGPPIPPLPTATPPSSYHNPPSLSQSSPTTLLIFPDARDFNLENFIYNEAPRQGPSSASITWKSGWNELAKHHAAPNALYNSSVLSGAPRCDEDHRVGVVLELMTDYKSDARLLCVTGPARSGKSCLQKTIAERCQEAGILVSSFFFCREDSSRNDPTAIAATMAYQVGLKHEYLRALIGEAVEKDPLIFSKSLSAQLTTLVVEPARRFHSKVGDGAARDFPYILLVDGLDECGNSNCQLDLLKVLKSSIIDGGDSLFRVCITSRPNSSIRRALGPPTGFLHGSALHIQLGNKDHMSDDRWSWLPWRNFPMIHPRRGKRART
ncbi:hypothetical protein DFP72DRAFT_120087 [Ephemerocybe angulata]|uniref:Nephrocystin 3-like N-terminal domain-containing protein n=1 Tax=Ephemerocybe angulata TaxID=980116 RepID=A0A8H6I8S2_9AGAR|nr:hypothetical protein DFP72DRAFT_120087 [Tulosesus angulatus]